MSQWPGSDSAQLQRMIDERVAQQLRQLLGGNVLKNAVPPRSLPETSIRPAGPARKGSLLFDDDGIAAWSQSPSSSGQAPVWDGDGWVPEDVATQDELDDVAADVTDLQSDVADLETDVADLEAGLDDHINDPTGAHAATAVSFTPAGNLAAIQVQAAIVELDSEKVAKSGDTMTGSLTVQVSGSSLMRVNAGDPGSLGDWASAYLQADTGVSASLTLRDETSGVDTSFSISKTPASGNAAVISGDLQRTDDGASNNSLIRKSQLASGNVSVTETGIIIPSSTNVQQALAQVEQYVQNLEERFEQHHHGPTGRVGAFSVPGATQLVSVTGVGFRPSIVVFTAGWVASTTAALMGSGAMDAYGTQWSDSLSEDAGARSSLTEDTSCLHVLAGGGAYIYRATFVSMDVDGFTVNFTHANNNGRVKWIAYA